MKWTNPNRILRNVALVAFALLSALQSHAQQKKPNTMLWEISGNGLRQPSYLFGTIHMICREDFQLTESVKQKINASAQVYLELDMDDPQLQGVLMQQMQLPENESLKSKLGERDFSKLNEFFQKELSMSLAMFDRFKPMMVMSLLTQRLLLCTQVESYEMNIMKMAIDQKKELLGLERVEDQVGVFDAIPDSLELKSIMNMVSDLEAQRRAYGQLLGYYKAGDVTSLHRLIIESPEMMGSQELLLERRNRNWVPVMESAMKKSPSFFAVGAGHLAGDQGVLQLLRSRGYKVRVIRK